MAAMNGMVECTGRVKRGCAIYINEGDGDAAPMNSSWHEYNAHNTSSSYECDMTENVHIIRNRSLAGAEKRGRAPRHHRYLRHLPATMSVSPQSAANDSSFAMARYIRSFTWRRFSSVAALPRRRPAAPPMAPASLFRAPASPAVTTARRVTPLFEMERT